MLVFAVWCICMFSVLVDFACLLLLPFGWCCCLLCCTFRGCVLLAIAALFSYC